MRRSVEVVTSSNRTVGCAPIGSFAPACLMRGAGKFIFCETNEANRLSLSPTGPRLCQKLSHEYAAPNWAAFILGPSTNDDRPNDTSAIGNNWGGGERRKGSGANRREKSDCTDVRYGSPMGTVRPTRKPYELNLGSGTVVPDLLANIPDSSKLP